MPERVPRWLVPSLVAILVIASASAVWAAKNDDLADGVAVAVGSHEITQDDLADRSRALQALYGIQKPTGAGELEEYWRDVAKSVVLGVLLDDAAAADGLTPSDQAAEQALQTYVASYYGEGEEGLQAFTQALGDAGTSQTAVLAEVGRQLQVSQLFESVTASVAAPTDEEIAAAYDKRRCLLAVEAQRTLRNIVTATRGDALAARARIGGGESFALVARAVSQDQSTAAKGGVLGSVSRSQLEKAYGAAAFSARVGEVFGPVKTRFGWNVGVVVDERPARTLTLEQSADILRDALLSEARSDLWHDWLAVRLAAADTTYADAYRPDDPLSPPAGFDPAATPDDKDC